MLCALWKFFYNVFHKINTVAKTIKKKRQKFLLEIDFVFSLFLQEMQVR